jgi:hypothetical protein
MCRTRSRPLASPTFCHRKQQSSSRKVKIHRASKQIENDSSWEVNSASLTDVSSVQDSCQKMTHNVRLRKICKSTHVRGHHALATLFSGAG